MRYLHLDGLRGIMLVSMMVSHLGWGLPVGPTVLLVFKTFMLTDAASAFVFLSGLTAGIVYGRKWLKPTARHPRHAVLARALLVYKHHAFLVLVVSGLALLAAQTGQKFWMFAAYEPAPTLFGMLSLLMVAGGWCLDILPMYVVFLLLTPVALSAIVRGRAWMVAGGAATAWLLGQIGFGDFAWNAIAQTTGLGDRGIHLGIYFNRLSWSALYFGGIMIGMAFVMGKLDLSRLKHPKFLSVMLLSIVTIAMCMVALAVSRKLSDTPYGAVLALLMSKPNLGILSLLNFCAALFAICWLLVAGVSSDFPPIRLLSRAVQRVVLWRPLVLLGQHSLPVFTFHLLLVYAFYFFVDTGSINMPAAQVIIAIGVIALFIPAGLNMRAGNARRQLLPTPGR